MREFWEDRPERVPITLEEYLHTSYEYDCEYVDGMLVHRPWPDGFHSVIQSFFIGYFGLTHKMPETHILPSLSLRVSPTRIRVADIVLLSKSAPYEPIPSTPPLLCVEILTPDDGFGEVQEKIADYVAMGVRAIWVVDPHRRTLFMAGADGTHPVTELTLPGTDVRLGAAEIFAELDERTGRV